jgi:hypothetical protein
MIIFEQKLPHKNNTRFWFFVHFPKVSLSGQKQHGKAGIPKKPAVYRFPLLYMQSKMILYMEPFYTWFVYLICPRV